MQIKSGCIAFKIFILAISCAYGQSLTPYNWQNERKLTNLPDSQLKEPLLYLKLDVMYQYVYEGPENALACYSTEHRIIRVNNDEALQRINRIYIPTGNLLELIDIKARAISPSGKVVQLDENNIKEVQDEQEGGGYKIFAIEGAEVGGEVEYFYTLKINPKYFGREYFQSNYPALSESFTLTCPENLEFDFESYNGLKEVVQIDTSKNVNVYELLLENVPALLEEAYSSYSANRQRIEYKLAYNSANSTGRLFTWNDAANRIYNSIYGYSEEEAKEVKRLIKTIDVDQLESSREKVAKAEHYIKTHFYLNENAPSESEVLGNILEQRFSNKRGLTVLFAAVLTEMKIPHQLVITEARNHAKFDKDFDSWNFLDEYLIYLPGEDTYLSPSSFQFRLGTIPAELSATYGLFIRPTVVRDYIYPVAELKWIKAPGYEHDFDNLQIEVSFNEELTETIVNAKRSFKGYQASYLKSAYLVLENEKKNELLRDLIEFLAPDASIKDIALENPIIDHRNWDEPFTISATFTTSAYLEQAGDIILFKAGELIGPQSELYQKEQRRSGVENEFNRGYRRHIKVRLPDGFSIENPDDLMMDVHVSEKNRYLFLFKSDYTLNLNLLDIKIDEYYDEIYFPLERFEEFRSVINAAADWNKVTLVIKTN